MLITDAEADMLKYWVALVVIGALMSSVFAAGPVIEPAARSRPPANTVVRGGDYTLIAWSDLGMHCISPRFSEMAILPPYNTIRAVVIERGAEPRVVTSGINVSYWMDNNISVKRKTDFWTYAPKLFGSPLKPGIGLTGSGLTGAMLPAGNEFHAVGIPVLPQFDNGSRSPYQRATIAMSVGRGGVLQNITSIVVPVSDEMNCAKCHKSGGVAARGISTPTVEGNILTLHDKRQGTRLMASRPVLCARCHSDNALGAAGTRGVSSLSLAMHGKHAALPAANQPVCYNCHPGQNTQCNRSSIKDMGPVHGDPRCDNCHGDLQKMAASLRAGRRPWLEEPTCSQCHGMKYDTGKVLYRQATGHGGVLCVACHNSPHAWWPSLRADDNFQPLKLQGNAHSIGFRKCGVCHSSGVSGTVPPHQED
jgi:hypothetical protein